MEEHMEEGAAVCEMNQQWPDHIVQTVNVKIKGLSKWEATSIYLRYIKKNSFFENHWLRQKLK